MDGFTNRSGPHIIFSYSLGHDIRILCTLKFITAHSLTAFECTVPKEIKRIRWPGSVEVTVIFLMYYFYAN